MNPLSLVGLLATAVVAGWVAGCFCGAHAQRLHDRAARAIRASQIRRMAHCAELADADRHRRVRP